MNGLELLVTALLVGSEAPPMTASVAVECIRVPFTAKQLMANAALVFVGDVEDIEVIPGRHRVTFDVLESYKGITVGKRTVDFRVEPRCACV